MKNPVGSNQPQTRREFCVNVCRAGSLLAIGPALGELLSGCEDPTSGGGGGGGGGSGLTVIQATASMGVITLTIDSSSPLAAVGSAAIVQYNGGALLVAHTAQDTFTALTTICTHQGCTINSFAGQVYQCPCHGSQFNTSGQVVRGPAGSPLRLFATQFASGQLTITL